MSVTSDLDLIPIALLEAAHHQGKEWDVIAPRYGVANLDPPWKTSLIGMCECLAVGGSLPTLDVAGGEEPYRIRRHIFGIGRAPFGALLFFRLRGSEN